MNLVKQYLNHWRLALRYNPKRYWTKCGTEYFNQHLPIGERGESIIVNALEKLEFSNLVDIGCGYGRYLKVIAQRFPEVKLTGIDISPTQIGEAKKYLLSYPQIELLETDGIRLPFKDRSFDVSFTYGCIMHVSPFDLNSFWREVCRITKGKGLFLESSYIKRSIKRLISPSVVWYSHDYDKLFKQFSLPYQVLSERKQNNIVERLYFVDFPNS